MRLWLAFCSVLPLAAATTALAQTKGLESPTASLSHRIHADAFRLSQQSWAGRPAPFVGGMVTSEHILPDALVGLGLVKMHGRARRESEMRAGASEVQTRKLGATVVLKF